MTCTFVAKRSINGEIAPQNLISVNVVWRCLLNGIFPIYVYAIRLSIAIETRVLDERVREESSVATEIVFRSFHDVCLCECARCSHTTTWSAIYFGHAK